MSRAASASRRAGLDNGSPLRSDSANEARSGSFGTTASNAATTRSSSAAGCTPRIIAVIPAAS